VGWSSSSFERLQPNSAKEADLPDWQIPVICGFVMDRITKRSVRSYHPASWTFAQRKATDEAGIPERKAARYELDTSWGTA
jgi:hypothetical protein